MLLKCFGAATSSTTVKNYVSDRYDEDNGTFERSLLHRTMIQTKRAAKQKGEKLNDGEAHTLAIATLKKAMQATDVDVNTVAAEIQD